MTAIYEKFYNKIMYSYPLKKRVMRLLKFPYLVNNLLYRYIYQKCMRKVMAKGENLPPQVVIENTNACSAYCIMCPHDKMRRKTGFMNMDLFQKIIKECVAQGIGYISIQGFGEPLMDRSFAGKVKYAKNMGIDKVISNTNAVLLNEEIAKAILDSGLDEIFISLDALSKETYERIRRGLKFDIVVNNVMRFLELKKKSKKTKPTVNLDFLQLKENMSETEKFIQRWRNSVGNICISSAHNWAGEKKNRSLDDFHSNSNRVKRSPCRLLWNQLVVFWDGRVPLCCQDYDGNMILGNLKQKHLRDIWQGKRLKNIRQVHIQGAFDKIPLCKRCTYYSIWW